MKSATGKILVTITFVAMVGGCIPGVMASEKTSLPESSGIQNQITSVYPVTFKTAHRLVDLEVKVTAPVQGDNLPIILISHGHGAPWYLGSYRGMAPLTDYYAANGFIVIQPTHQDSRILGLDKKGPEGALFWKSRIEDMAFCIDHLDELINSVPNLSTRAKKSDIAAVGFSMGGQTVSMLAGTTMRDPVSGKKMVKSDQRIKAFVTLGAPGNGNDVAEWALKNYPAITGVDYSTMTRDALIIVGDRDKNPQFSTRDDWRFDIYKTSPAPKTLLTLVNTGHMLGGIMGYDAYETSLTDDENPETLLFIQKMTTAYIRSKLNPTDNSWALAMNELNEMGMPKGKIEFKK
ncbi:chlorophyllase [Citrobacter sp. wls619]|uniref:alpha/beta hydrolase family protein n=1 Tax=Citrobacter sp. wls619 TaxID=2576432 RepID=UPI0010C950CE|nr:chlorophyllase [Citrobacter sp. wls619]TKV07670.1 chlorophyllase [Citrobacter sp. wls619]